MRNAIIAGLVMSTLACGSAHAEHGRNAAAVLGGAAAGFVGGAILGSALAGQPRPAPVYVQPAPPPPPTRVEYIEQPRRVVVVDEYESQADRLHEACDDGNRHACVRFGILIGQHRERVASWRRSHPDFFSYED